MKLFQFCFLTISLVSLSAAHGGGWEVGGGDVYALKFVKTARLMAEDIGKNQYCSLHKAINLTEFKHAIETVEVSTSMEDLKVANGKIVVNRQAWPFMTTRGKLETVLKAYSQNTSTPFTGVLSSQTRLSCFNSYNWRLIFKDVPEDTNSNLAIPQDVATTAQRLLTRLMAEPDAEVLKRFDLCKLQSAMIHTNTAYWSGVKKLSRSESCASAIASSKEVLVGTTPIALRYGENELKDGLNYKSDHHAEVLINRSLWRQMTHGQRMELLLHEYLSVIGSNDRHYQISSLLFHDLPVQDYAD
jgi:hypothetical protein